MNLMADSTPPPDPGALVHMHNALGAVEATVLQDQLLTTFNDLERLQRLLDDMCDVLIVHFMRAHEKLNTLEGHTQEASPEKALRAEIDAIRAEITGAVTGLQFQDMGTQLIAHTLRRLRNCADRLAQGTLGDEDGPTVVTEAPTRPNPVTQDEMDAGSIELF